MKETLNLGFIQNITEAVLNKGKQAVEDKIKKATGLGSLLSSLKKEK